MKQGFRFSMLRDPPEQHGNRFYFGIFRLQVSPAFMREVFLHPVSGFDQWTTEMMQPFLTVEILECPRLTWIYHKGIEPACQGLCFLDSAAALVQENAGIVRSNGFQEIHKVAAFIQQFRFRKFAEKLIHAADV